MLSWVYRRPWVYNKLKKTKLFLVVTLADNNHILKDINLFVATDVNIDLTVNSELSEDLSMRTAEWQQ